MEANREARAEVVEACKCSAQGAPAHCLSSSLSCPSLLPLCPSLLPAVPPSFPLSLSPPAAGVCAHCLQRDPGRGEHLCSPVAPTT